MNAIDAYAETLASALHGPSKAKARIVQDIREGLTDTVEAHKTQGATHTQATKSALEEFGTPEDLTPTCQRELTIAQTRKTAQALALAVPVLTTCTYLTHLAAPGMAIPLITLTALSALMAATTFTATGTLSRRLPTRDRFPLLVAWTSTTAAITMGITAIALALTAALTTNWPLIAAAGALTAISHAAVANASKTCRLCAHLPQTPTICEGP
ncbi:permease prefix domain 1-containing protein [Spirillospora sp. CA-294931]|uniref:permease prefix domain 1-containing protein n=1 Tax=Spirillospora sp. CA-294931 TaxID=3240042 RepID=UPI003D8AE467